MFEQWRSTDYVPNDTGTYKLRDKMQDHGVIKN